VTEFTGERVIPGEVDADLLNEHLARYAFAARLARGRRVLDAGCGIGYGAVQLAAGARRVAGLELAPGVAAAARLRYAHPRVDFLCGDASRLPFPDGSFDLVVAFEVIEHLEAWDRLLTEARRVLGPAGLFVVSTPNRLYYSESRAEPNPFHVHEFEYEEFREALERHFPHVRMLLENHSEGVVFSLPEATEVETFIEAGLGCAGIDPQASHFFVAVCSADPVLASPPFIYLPQTGNILRQRERHIALLQGELKQKDLWLQETKQALEQMTRNYEDLERHATAAITALEQDNAEKVEWNRRTQQELERLQGLLDALQAEFEARSRWALQLEGERAELQSAYARLDAEAQKLRSDLQACVDQLHTTEAELDSRTAWALGLDKQVQALTADLNALFGSPAYKLGRRLGLAPTPPSDPRHKKD
jgi:SAM-dependent methyltransferase